jgi:cardiolipin synthase
MADTTDHSFTLPNIVTLLRLLCVPVVVYLILEGRLDLAFWVFLVAGISDGVDGYLAKRFNQRSLLGSYIDPLADKALLVSVYIALGLREDIATWLVILVVFRDVVIVGGLMLEHMLRDRVVMRPLMISKINTVVQITLAIVVLAGPGLGLYLTDLVNLLMYLTALTTTVSGVAYVWNGLSGRDIRDVSS